MVRLELASLLRQVRKVIYSYVEERKFLWLIYAKVMFAIYKIEHRLLLIANNRPYIKNSDIYKKIDNKKICHVLGNGMSVNETIKNINDVDFVIAISSGGILPLKIDMLILELHPLTDIGKISLKDNVKYINIIIDIVLRRNKKAIVFIKNLWRMNVSPNLYDPNKRLFVLHEMLCRFFPQTKIDSEFEDFLIDYIVNIENQYVIQVASSVITAIIIAYKAGFEKIIIHGVDGGGAHFFHNSKYDTKEYEMLKDVIEYLRVGTPFIEKEVQYKPGYMSKKIIEKINILGKINNAGFQITYADRINLNENI